MDILVPMHMEKPGPNFMTLKKISGKNNVASQFPEIVKRLKKMGEKAREKLGDMRKKGKGVRPPGRIMD